MIELKDNIVLITGASSGIGKELAIRFAKEGAKLFVTANEPMDLKELKALTEVEGIVGDLTDPEFVKFVAKSAISHYGKLDILINNAGVLIPGRFGQTDVKNWDKVIQLNLTAPFILTNELANIMNEKAFWPLILNISSMSGVVGAPFCASYVASKYGLVGLTDAINEEFRIHGNIRAIAICPGTIETPGMRKVNTPGISPKPGDPVLDKEHVAEIVLFFAKLRDHVDLDKIVFKKRKNEE